MFRLRSLVMCVGLVACLYQLASADTVTLPLRSFAPDGPVLSISRGHGKGFEPLTFQFQYYDGKVAEMSGWTDSSTDVWFHYPVPPGREIGSPTLTGVDGWLAGTVSYPYADTLTRSRTLLMRMDFYLWIYDKDGRLIGRQGQRTTRPERWASTAFKIDQSTMPNCFFTRWDFDTNVVTDVFISYGQRVGYPRGAYAVVVEARINARGKYNVLGGFYSPLTSLSIKSSLPFYL